MAPQAWQAGGETIFTQTFHEFPAVTDGHLLLVKWESLREAASAIKAHTLSRLADYLEEFERNATANGIQVHWARDAAEHNAIVHGILARHGVTRLVKSKSPIIELES